MPRLCALALALALLAGCSGRPTVTNPAKSSAQTQADYDECVSQGALASALPGKGQDPEQLREKRIDECMKAKGYDVK